MTEKMIHHISNADDLDIGLSIGGLVGQPIIVDFARRQGCVPCKRLEPHFKAVANNLVNLTYAVVHLDELSQDDLSKIIGKFNISATPTVLMFVNDNIIELRERTAPKLINEIESNL